MSSELMSLWQQIHSLIINRDVQVNEKAVVIVKKNNYQVIKYLIQYWNSRSQSQKNILILTTISLSLGIYILYPSIVPQTQNNMFSKRPDKHTTGLINLRNDCFANSSLQAYLALPGLTEYLNEFIGSFQELKTLIENNGLKIDEDIESSSKSKKSDQKFEIPLHISLAKLVRKLQETQMTSRTISVWTFLHSLEKIFNAKISRSQHDAHELTQLINETLENENIKVIKKLKFLKTKSNCSGVLLEDLNKINVPEFPFSGLILTRMKCLACANVSKPSLSPFLMLTLHTPQELSTKLEELLDKNESEQIEGYQCIKCRIRKIIEHENYLEGKGAEQDPKEEKYIKRIRQLDNDSKICINEDLPEDLENFIKSYNKNGIDISKVCSTVFRKTQILKPPKLFGLHLSRSNFNGVNITRNPCNVSFQDSLTLSIGKEYHDELKQFQVAALEDADYLNINSAVLTTDVNDMEDEDVQREDIDEKGPDDDDDDDQAESTVTEDDEVDDDDDDATSISSVESHNSMQTASTVRNESLKDSKYSESLSSTRTPDTLNNAPISSDQTDDLKKYFKQFKFNDNDIYKYRLRAVIRHQGSHTQGHYECYKKKPLYVKNKDGNIIKLSPEILESVVNETEFINQDKEEPETASSENSLARRRKFSLSLSNNDGYSDAQKSRTSSNGSNESSGFREKFSTMMGRRPSVFQADPAEANIHEILDSGLTTPAELLINDLPQDYFDNFSDTIYEKIEKLDTEHREDRDIDSTGKENGSIQRVKMKKIPSLIKHPFWRISDSQVTEVSRASVLCETSSVYMLYYERVDRKHIKQSKLK